MTRLSSPNPRRRAAAATRTARRHEAVPCPLDVVYAQAGIEAPATRRVTADEIPTPYRALLAHERDMTLTLEAHFGGRVALRALSTFQQDHCYYRRVLLVQAYSGRPVEMGAIKIDLQAFTARVRREILRGEVPFGRLLRDGGIDYRSRPTQYLAVTPNSEMMGAFWMREPLTLYGRQTEVSLRDRKIGDIVEILPLA